MRVPDLIYCANGNPRFAEIAKRHNFLLGAQLPGTIYDIHKPLYFADQDFKKPRYVSYIKAIRKYQPYMASVLDIEEWRRLDEYLMRAEEVSKYCQVVMLIPKVSGIIAELPREINGKEVRLGYSVDTKFGKTDVPTEEFKKWPVHLLGGSPLKQLALMKQMNIVSTDGNYAHKLTRFCQFFYPESLWDEKYKKIVEIDKKKKVKDRKIKNPIWPTLFEFDGKKWGDGSSKADAPYEAFERSCKNIMEYWYV